MTSAAIAVLDANMRWTRQLFSRMSGRAKVFMMEPRDLRTAWSAGWSPTSVFRLTEDAPDISSKRYVFPPGWFSRFPAPFMRFLAREARHWFESTQASERVLAISYPHYAPAVALSRPSMSVYYWSDEFRAYWPRQRRKTTLREREAVATTDLTVCASLTKAEELSAELPEHAGKITHLIHGHHPGLLPDHPLSGPATLPPDIAHLKRPVLGHWGQVSDHLDFEIAHRVASALPDASVVFIGPMATDFDAEQRGWFEACRRLPNVHFKGPRPYDTTSGYIPSFDVCLSLYRPDLEFTRVTNPSKIRDYLASTRPIVSTAIPDVVKLYSGFLRIGYSPEEYVGHVRDLISMPRTDGSGEERLRFARDHTWPRVADELWRLLESARSRRPVTAS